MPFDLENKIGRNSKIYYTLTRYDKCNMPIQCNKRIMIFLSYMLSRVNLYPTFIHKHSLRTLIREDR